MPPDFSWYPVGETVPEAQPDPPAGGQRYLLPCHLLHHGGLYEYVLVEVAQARQWMLAGPVQSYITHPMLHQAFQDVMGFWTPLGQHGRLPPLGFEDDALIFQVYGYETLPDLRRGDSRKVRELVEAKNFTLGLLRRVA